MATVVRAIDVDVPVRTAYRQWTRFEDFPRFMEGVREVRWLDDDRLRWVAVVGGRVTEREVRIVDRQPGERLSWRSADGTGETTAVSLRPVGTAAAAVTVRVEYEPVTVRERAGDVLGVVGRRVEGDLRRFKRLVERQGDGGWWPRGRRAVRDGPATGGEPGG